jgi:hypothetical protein
VLRLRFDGQSGPIRETGVVSPSPTERTQGAEALIQTGSVTSMFLVFMLLMVVLIGLLAKPAPWRTLHSLPRSIEVFRSLPVARVDYPLGRRTGYYARMTQWLRGKTLFQKVALADAVGGEPAIVSYCSGRTSTAEFVLLALILCYIAFRKELLWRIRNRLLITSFLFAVVPIILIGWALIIATELLLGQFATQRVHQDLEARIETVRATAESLTLAASHGAFVPRRPVPDCAAVDCAGIWWPF